ncbi:hypothetical protein [Roseospira navarrensis]|uniref:Uncharacterized protein n=1 Tax=Roseospira navarrensis TaxID=140058 RepID=A0A7X1ZG35_9PROT|nr:hypothetical protein [Roseospira navarrensis]
MKSEEKQALGMTLGVRDLLVRQRTQTINAVRGHRAAFGLVGPQGTAHLGRVRAAVAEASGTLPKTVVEGATLDRAGRKDRQGQTVNETGSDNPGRRKGANDLGR